MTTAVVVVTGARPALVVVSEAERISEPKRRGWLSSSIETFVGKGERAEFAVGENARIEVRDLPETCQDLLAADQVRGMVGAANAAPTLANALQARDKVAAKQGET